MFQLNSTTGNNCKRESQSDRHAEDGILTYKLKTLESVLISSKVTVLLYTGNMDSMIHTLGIAIFLLTFPKTTKQVTNLLF